MKRKAKLKQMTGNPFLFIFCLIFTGPSSFLEAHLQSKSLHR